MSDVNKEWNKFKQAVFYHIYNKYLGKSIDFFYLRDAVEEICEQLKDKLHSKAKSNKYEDFLIRATAENIYKDILKVIKK